MPGDLRSVLSLFLGGEERRYYLPSQAPGRMGVQDVVKSSFRFPVRGAVSLPWTWPGVVPSCPVDTCPRCRWASWTKAVPAPCPHGTNTCRSSVAALCAKSHPTRTYTHAHHPPTCPPAWFRRTAT